MFEELLKEYRETGAQLRRIKTRNVKDPVVKSNEVTLLSSMIAEVDWSIDYMENGFSKDAFRGIHRREIPMNPQVMAQLFAQKSHVPRQIMYGQSEEMAYKVIEIMSKLSDREREAFMLVKVECLSYGKAAVEMGVTKARVQGCIIRAEEKIKKMINKEVKEKTLAVVC